MSDLTIRLINLIKADKSIEEISEELNLSYKQIYNILVILKNKGIEFQKHYYDNGTMKFSLINRFTKSDDVEIITDPNTSEFSFIAMSDIHIGSELSNINLINLVYDYCVKSNIHNIFLLGDLIDGTFGGDKNIESPLDQIDFLVKNYPLDKNILNYTILGDHDYSALIHENINMKKYLENYRPDIVNLGYRTGKVKIKNDYVYLNHPFNSKHNFRSPDNTSITLPNRNTIILQGHKHHQFTINHDHNSNLVNLYLPTISDLRDLNEIPYPSVAKLKLYFNNKKQLINSIYIEPLMIINNKFIKENEVFINNLDYSNNDFTKVKK